MYVAHIHLSCRIHHNVQQVTFMSEEQNTRSAPVWFFHLANQVLFANCLNGSFSSKALLTGQEAHALSNGC